MEIEIVEKKDNALLGRMEVKFRVHHMSGPTPTRDQVREKVAALVNSKKNLTIVDEMHSTFGKGETIGHARVYANQETIATSEPLHLLKRNKLEELAPKKKGAAAKK